MEVSATGSGQSQSFVHQPNSLRYPYLLNEEQARFLVTTLQHVPYCSGPHLEDPLENAAEDANAGIGIIIMYNYPTHPFCPYSKANTAIPTPPKNHEPAVTWAPAPWLADAAAPLAVELGEVWEVVPFGFPCWFSAVTLTPVPFAQWLL